MLLCVLILILLLLMWPIDSHGKCNPNAAQCLYRVMRVMAVFIAISWLLLNSDPGQHPWTIYSHDNIFLTVTKVQPLVT